MNPLSLAAFERLGYSLWAIEVRSTGMFAGFIGQTSTSADLPFAPAIEIGWRLAYTHWGKGYAAEGARAALRYRFDQIGVSEIVSYTAARNLRSRRVMERLGMTHDPSGHFIHPKVPAGRPLAEHVLYRARRRRFHDAKQQTLNAIMAALPDKRAVSEGMRRAELGL